jgi:hypothetical protein
MVKTSVTKTEYERDSGEKMVQFKITIPKKLAEALDIDHKDTGVWSIVSSTALKIDFRGDDE